MRRLSLCMWTILALLFLVSSGTGQDRYPATSKSWLPRFLQFKRIQPTVKKKVETPTAKASTEPQTPPVSPVLMMNPKSAEALRKAEQEKWERRVNVCDRLRQIAVETGDADLEYKAEYLNQRAWETYLQRTGQARPLNSAVAVESDSNMIQQYLRGKARDNPDFSNLYSEQRIRANVEEQP